VAGTAFVGTEHRTHNIAPIWAVSAIGDDAEPALSGIVEMLASWGNEQLKTKEDAEKYPSSAYALLSGNKKENRPENKPGGERPLHHKTALVVVQSSLQRHR
jgi:hypothetical protein